MKISLKTSILFFLCLSTLIVTGQSPLEATGHSCGNHNHKAGLQFIENQNQWHPNIEYSCALGGLNYVFLENKTLTYLLYAEEETKQLHDVIKESKEVRENHIVPGHAYKVHFLNALTPQFSQQHKRSASNNYFIGNDPAKWASEVPAHYQITYEDIYENIQLTTYSQAGDFKYDFIVAPNGNPESIQLLYEGTDALYLDEGDLVIETSVQTVKELKPYAYQMIDGKEREIHSEYVLTNNVLSFNFPEGYNPNLPLVIDPTVVGATLSGTDGGTNYGHAATYDNDGNIYTGGIAFGTGYPTTVGSFQENFAGGGTDIVISKYNSTATNLIYATYLGGGGSEYPHSLFVDANDQLCVHGTTSSSDFPVTSSSFQTTHGGESDIIITKLNVDGNALAGSTYLGGSGSDGVNTSSLNSNYGDFYRGEIMLDGQGDIYLASCSQSDDFPVSNNAFQSELNTDASQDGVVMKLSSDLSTLYWSTYLGGDDPDMCMGMRVLDSGNVYVTGFAGDATFPMVTGGVQESWPGGEESAYVVQLSSDGSSMIAGTFWGSEGDEHGFLIDLDSDDNVHFIGQTTGDIEVTPSTYFYNLGSRQFITAFNSDLNSLVYSTVIGTGNDSLSIIDFVPSAFGVDNCNNIYFSGYNSSDELPMTSDTLSQPGNYFYIGVLEPNATALSFGGYYGNANHVDGGMSRFDKDGRLYQAVCSGTGSGLQTTPGAWATTQSVTWDVGVVKIDFESNSNLITASAAPVANGCAPYAVDFEYTGMGGETILWDFGNGDTSTEFNPSYTFTERGVYAITQTISATSVCNVVDSYSFDVVILEGNGESSVAEKPLCDGLGDLTLEPSITGADYEWQDGSTAESYAVSAEGIYWVDIIVGACSERDTFVVTAVSPINFDFGENQSFCDQETYNLNATTGLAVSYEWQDGSTDPIFEVSETGDYWVVITDASGCVVVDSINVFIDNEPPVITCPEGIDTFALTTDPMILLDFGLPMVTDDCSTNIYNDYTASEFSEGTFPSGFTTVTWYAVDELLNESTCETTVFVDIIDGVDDMDDLLSLTVYPNPGPGLFVVEYDKLDLSSLQFKVFNTLGSLIYESVEKSLTGKTIIDLSEEASGVYYLTWSTEQEQGAVKLLKHKK